MKKYLKFAVMAAFTFIAGLTVYHAQARVQLSDAQLENVEALANDESSTCTEWVLKTCYDEFSEDVGENFYPTSSGTPSVSGGILRCGAPSIYKPKFFTNTHDCLFCVRYN